ncbi:hypothetical protein [Armatimonas rosea]|uniref:Uncharacterized protein n=1 Tax=Armatimonas rosea TaxID=685828 RepID=A0A7W9WAB9_ARMRO|nr:hypothetical protein [Armatimonas rosea]MBB6054135.1 hypothetical protein [Armatimonas rosea]
MLQKVGTGLCLALTGYFDCHQIPGHREPLCSEKALWDVSIPRNFELIPWGDFDAPEEEVESWKILPGKHKGISTGGILEHFAGKDIHFSFGQAVSLLNSQSNGQPGVLTMVNGNCTDDFIKLVSLPGV